MKNREDMKMSTIFERLEAARIVPVIAIRDAAKAPDLARALLAGGFACAEVTFRTEAGEEAIRRVAAEVPDILLGAGTVLKVEQAKRAVAAGAKFIVSPGFNPGVVRWCIENEMPILPGCSTPTEMEQAMAFGLTRLKFFPAEQSGGLEYIKAVSAPYPSLRFVPTGGINAQNLRKYLDFPKILACGGSWMVPKELIEAGDFEGITALCKDAMAIVNGEAEPKSVISKPAVSAAQPTAPPQAVVAFGELMLRFAPEGYLRFVQADRFQATFGGAEANVAVDLCSLGIPCSFVTKLPKHEIGQLAVNSLRRYGVDTQNILRGGNRVGTYYVEKGASQRASKVIYDRAGSAIAEAKPGEFDWDAILADARWFHFTGVTPALSESAAALCLEACQAARRLGVPVSCDLNYRKNLWSRERAGQVMAALLPYVTLCIANEEDAADVFGIHAAGSNIEGGSLSHEGYEDVARQLAGRFGLSEVAITLRKSISASDNIWGAMLYTGGQCYFSREYPVHIVDRVGGGDSFGAGLIFAALEGQEPQERLEFATAASCLKHAVEGDFNLVNAEEVRKLAGGSGSGRVQR